MSKIINDYKSATVLEKGQRIEKHWEKFSLVVVQPIKGKEGRLVFTADIHAENVTSAVKTLREQIDGSGWIVLQSSAYTQEVKGTAIEHALVKAYGEKYA